tara:strand:- start:72782 stop:74038 length:1257 start_codon:yes stop_codon:yes gene_type:complete
VITNYEYLLFKRFFLSKKNEGYISIISWFSLIGIMLGVAVLIIVMSVMNGFRDELVKRIIGANGHLNIYSINKIISKKDLISLKSYKLFEDIKFNGIIETQGLIISNNSSKGIFIRGINSNDLLSISKFKDKIIRGKIYQNDKNQIIIGENLAKTLSVNVDDNIKIAVPKSDMTIFGNIPRFKTMKISGIFKLGMYEYDSNLVYTPLDISRSLTLLNDEEFNNIEIFVEYPDKLLLYLNKLKKFIDEKNLDKYYLISWKDRNKAFLDALNIERNVMFLILILIILIASLNIVSGLIIFVKDKNMDIGILRTIGLSKISLVKIFLLIGSTIGLIGTTFGILIGLIFCINVESIQFFLESFLSLELFSPEIYYLSKLPAKIDYLEVFYIGLLSILLTFISTIYPAIKSSKIDPIKTIRNE